MAERSAVQRFLATYRAAFAAFDAAAIADLFAYPCHMTSDAGEIAVTTVPTRTAWLPQIERLLASYRAIGARSAEVRELEVVELTPRLAQATVAWRLAAAEGQTIYDFDASYTLADLGAGMVVTAVAHNELPRLRAALARRTG